MCNVGRTRRTKFLAEHKDPDHNVLECYESGEPLQPTKALGAGHKTRGGKVQGAPPPSSLPFSFQPVPEAPSSVLSASTVPVRSQQQVSGIIPSGITYVHLLNFVSVNWK